MEAPQKPFSGYKWIWASYAPTESLNDPAVFLGVLRAMWACEGKAKSSAELFAELKRVEREMEGRHPQPVTLARSRHRNLIRNSGQYWQGTGLLLRRSGTIQLSDLGRRVADGKVSRRELAVAIIKSLSLPNRNIKQDWSDWDNFGIVIRPLELILSILTRLKVWKGAPQSKLSVEELVRIVIPLAGSVASVDEHCEAILEHRSDRLDLSDWPDCAPGSNDTRMAREFLLFLEHHGFVKSSSITEQTFALSEYAHLDWMELESLPSTDGDGSEIIEVLRDSRIGLFSERERQLVEQLARPGQQSFRREVLNNYDSRCLLTGERMPDVLVAAHIIPVKYRGADSISNGLCLRSDIHTLFDGGHIRVGGGGDVGLSEAVESSVSYSGLPRKVDLPGFVAADALAWRWNYN